MASVFEARCSTFQEFEALIASSPGRQAEMEAYEHALIVPGQFTVSGYCVLCETTVDFIVDYWGSYATWNGVPVPNWREAVACPLCHLNNRMRASLVYLLVNSKPDDVIYLTEATTAMYAALKYRRPNAIGSEFLGVGTPRGTINEDGIRHEDATWLTFADRTFDLIGTFDVLEHVPSYTQAIAEFFRCLRPGGLLVVTVPIVLFSQETVIRATVDDAGNISHLLEPEIHGNPVNPEGSLCFYNHGWEFIQHLRSAGFEDARIWLYWNPELGYLGAYQAIITGRRPASGALRTMGGLR